MKQHNKLVRDLIPDICKANGDTPHMHIIQDDKGYLQSLIAKLREETDEIEEDTNVEELADALEVLYAIGKTQGFSPEQIEAARAQKAQKRGGFDKRIFLEYTD